MQDALQKRVTESFKAVNDQLEQVYKGLGDVYKRQLVVFAVGVFGGSHTAVLEHTFHHSTVLIGKAEIGRAHV